MASDVEMRQMNGRAVHFDQDLPDGVSMDLDAKTDSMLFQDNKTWSKGRLRKMRLMSMLTMHRQPTRRKIFSEIRVSKDFKEWDIVVHGVSIRCAKIYNPALLLKQRSAELTSFDVDELAEFQRFVTNLPEVQRLELEDPEGTLTTFPKQFVSQVPKLESLSMTWTKIKTLPPGLFQLPLNSLYLQRNQIKSVDGIERAESLTILDISNNKLETLPRTFGTLVNLVTLNLSGNALRELPESIGNLNHLKSLDVSSNKLRVIPDTIRTAIDLASLDVSNNQLTILPDSLCGLPNLEDLRARSNQLRLLPADFGQLRRLNSLLLRNNKFEEVPTQLSSLTSLTNLNMRENAIAQMAKPITSLKYLVLDNNELTSIGPAITSCSHLQLLSLKHNKITVIPPAVCQLQNLKSLHLSENDIDALPTQLSELKQLRHLSVSSTKLQTIPIEIAEMSSLSTLEMDDCTEMDVYLKMEYKNKGLDGLREYLREQLSPRDDDEESAEYPQYAQVNKPKKSISFSAENDYEDVKGWDVSRQTTGSKPLIDLTTQRQTRYPAAVAEGDDDGLMRVGRKPSGALRNQAGLSIMPGTSVPPPEDEATPIQGGPLVHIARQSICPSDPLPHSGGAGGARNAGGLQASLAAEAAARQRQLAAGLHGSGRGRTNHLAMINMQPEEDPPIIETLPAFGDLVSASNTDGSVRIRQPVAAAAEADYGRDEEDEDEMSQLYAKVSKAPGVGRPATAKKPTQY